jgi:hypothetical protein
VWGFVRRANGGWDKLEVANSGETAVLEIYAYYNSDIKEWTGFTRKPQETYLQREKRA